MYIPKNCLELVEGSGVFSFSLGRLLQSSNKLLVTNSITQTQDQTNAIYDIQ